jgi:hypothetical protein
VYTEACTRAVSSWWHVLCLWTITRFFSYVNDVTLLLFLGFFCFHIAHVLKIEVPAWTFIYAELSPVDCLIIQCLQGGTSGHAASPPRSAGTISAQFIKQKKRDLVDLQGSILQELTLTTMAIIHSLPVTLPQRFSPSPKRKHPFLLSWKKKCSQGLSQDWQSNSFLKICGDCLRDLYDKLSLLFFCWVWSQSFMLAKQVLYHLSHTSSSFLLWLFWIWALKNYLSRLALDCEPPDLSLP